ncbi:Imm42 family immunity protein [Pseudomonas indica]|uniref:Imm42 family immunity protein n=1 Tax=Pseudomonas indica TaxID=137658 RepID=UPI0023F84A44|nr:Imm42 family immunity protein [Pseudomonas indica]MBU3059037.1 immunity 42 family protein [Pseudomonas indica]
MLIGNREIFAVECEIENVIDGWVLGRFFLWIHGVVVGDQDDYSVDMNGCLKWLHDFVENPKNRYEPGLYDMHKDQVFLRLASSVLAHEDPQELIDETYEDTFSRFHISHIGMSSFDCATLLFLKNEHGLERLVWKVRCEEVSDAHLNPGEVEQVFLITIRELEETISHSSTC